MAEENDTGTKTEAPSGKRISQAREDGMVGKSIDLSQVLGMSAAFVALQYIGPLFWDDMTIILRGGFTSRFSTEEFTLPALRLQFFGLLWLLLPHVLALMTIAAFFGAGSTAIQTKFLWSWKLVKPKFNYLNPIQGIKRLFSIANAVNLLKSIGKLCIIGPIAYFAFIDMLPRLITLMGIPITQLLPIANDAMSTIFWKIIKFMVVFALCDFAWQKYSTHKKLKMTKVEVKEEHKAQEGDESVRMQIRSKGLTRIRQRMMHAVKRADVVVTNPTHLAIALEYDFAPGSAPKVIAKGRGYVAEKIKEIARANNVPVIERKPLARALFKMVEVGQSIPFELYQAVAELLAFVYKLKGKNPLHKSNNGPQPSTSGKRPSRN